MKIVSLPTLIFSSIVLSVSGASAGVYIQGVVQWLDTDYDNSIGIGARLGYAFDEMNSIELEFTQTDLTSIDTEFFQNGINTPVQGKADLSIILVNYRFTYPLTERFRLLAGAGIGGTVGKLDISTDSGRDDGTNAVFTFQGFAGVEYFILPQLSVHGAYRLIVFDDFTYKDSSVEVKVDPGNAQVLELGVSFYF